MEDIIREGVAQATYEAKKTLKRSTGIDISQHELDVIVDINLIKIMNIQAINPTKSTAN